MSVLERVRTSDPTESHMAAVASEHNINRVKQAVLELIFDLGLPTGKDLNRRYAEVQERRGYPVTDTESPRKRAGELVAEGFAERMPNPNGRGAFYILNLNGFNRLGADS